MLKTKPFFILRLGMIFSANLIIALLPAPGGIPGGWAQAQDQPLALNAEEARPQFSPPLPAQPNLWAATMPSLRDIYRQQQAGANETDRAAENRPPQATPAPGPQPAPDQAASAVSLQPPAVQPVPPPLPSVSLPPSRRGTVTLNFDDADVYSIIQTIFGEVLKANYVVDPRVKGRVTFRAVAPVPAESVLPLMEVIMRLNGIGVVEDNGLYRIVPLSDISKEPSPVGYGREPDAIKMVGTALLQVVPIIYIPSSEAIKLITPFASNNAVLIEVPKSNQIIIVDTDANVKRLLKLVEIFDNEKLKQRKPQVFVYQVQNGLAKDIASLLQQVFLGGKGAAADRVPPPSRSGAGNLTTPPSPSAVSAASTVLASPGGEMQVSDATRIISDETANSLIIMSTPEDFAVIKETILQIDIVPRQVVIEGMIASVALTDNLSLGLAALFKGNVGNLNARFGLNPGSLNIDPNGLSTSGFTFVGTDVVGAVRGLITALATESKAKLLATPHILVSSNKDAKIQVGQQVPLVTSETYGTPGVAPQRNIQYRDIGIILKVKPRVNDGGLVALDLYQEVSTFSTISLTGTDQQIILNKTDATTSLVVQDNQTIVIGGLIREDTSKDRSGIPFLSRIPILGWLFGNTNDDKSRQEIIILLTPHVIKNQKEAKEISNEYIDNMSESSKGGIKKEDIIKEKPRKYEEGNK